MSYGTWSEGFRPGGINRRGIFTGHWDGGDVVRQFRGDNGSWIGLAAYKAKEEPEPQP